MLLLPGLYVTFNDHVRVEPSAGLVDQFRDAMIAARGCAVPLARALVEKKLIIALNPT
jgi:hypothetical protein